MKIKDKILEQFHKGKTYNEIVKEIGCSKAIVSYYCSSLKNPNKRIIITNELISLIDKNFREGKTYDEITSILKIGKGSIKKYKSIRKNIDWSKLSEIEKKNLLRENNTKTYKKRREIIKKRSIEYKGGKCKKCGYKKHYGLDFHHIDMSTKDFDLSLMYKKSWEKIKTELDKTELLCSNCHREFHYFNRSENISFDQFLKLNIQND